MQPHMTCREFCTSCLKNVARLRPLRAQPRTAGFIHIHFSGARHRSRGGSTATQSSARHPVSSLAASLSSLLREARRRFPRRPAGRLSLILAQATCGKISGTDLANVGPFPDTRRRADRRIRQAVPGHALRSKLQLEFANGDRRFILETMDASGHKFAYLRVGIRNNGWAPPGTSASW